MTDKNVYPTIFIKRLGKKGKPERQGCGEIEAGILSPNVKAQM